MPKHSAAVDTLLGTKYQKLADLSSGSFGFVQLAENKETKEKVAIKFLKRDHITRYVECELINHRELRHPHVIEFKEVFLTQEHICIAMEYAQGASLFKYVQQCGILPEKTARWFFQQLIIGVDFCHHKGVVNRDMKLENVLLQTYPGLPLPLVKICDFGYSKSECMSAPKSRVGTLAYMAPEILTTSRHYDGKKADIWSCGVMLYIMLYGQYPFEPVENKLSYGARVKLMLQRIAAKNLNLPSKIPITPHCLDLLQKLLTADPHQRLTIHQIYQHPWFLTNLPPDALAMNDKFYNAPQPRGSQSIQEIKAVLEAAHQPTTPSLYSDHGAYMGGSFEDLVDGWVDAEVELMLP